jgi:hypothetical protein
MSETRGEAKNSQIVAVHKALEILAGAVGGVDGSRLKNLLDCDVDQTLAAEIRKSSSRAEFLLIIQKIRDAAPPGAPIKGIDTDALYNTLVRRIRDGVTEYSYEGKPYEIVTARPGRGPGGISAMEVPKVPPVENRPEAILGGERNPSEFADDQTAQAGARVEESEQQKKKREELEKYYYPYVRRLALKNRENCAITAPRLFNDGTWANPDLVSVDVETLPLLRTVDISITCYEVKLSVSIEAIYQSLHYTNFSHYVYIAFAQSETTIREARQGRVFNLAVEKGIGVLCLDEQKQEEGGTLGFREIQAPQRYNPENLSINSFLEAVTFHGRDVNIRNYPASDDGRFQYDIKERIKSLHESFIFEACRKAFTGE